MRLGIAGMGIATPLGTGKADVAEALFAGTRTGLAHEMVVFPDRRVRVGRVSAALPQAPTRNDGLMRLVLDQIAQEVSLAKARFGAHRIAVILGTSTSGIAEGEAAYLAQKAGGAWPAGFHYQHQELGRLAEGAASYLGLSGPSYTVATACSSSAKVFASARRLIAAGLCDAAVVGGADTLCATTVNGFASLDAMARGLCQPFSCNRDGINIGEGAAAFLLTPEAADIALLGLGEGSDAYHLSAPDPSGAGAAAAMTAALADAAVSAGDIAYVNLHGTGTALNDAMEGLAVAQVFGPDTPCSSTKGMTGHMLGAAGACEAAFLYLALHPGYGAGRLPPHLWDGEADPAIPPLRLVAQDARVDLMVRCAMLSNSFAFGGSNMALILGRGAW
ncbi:beta-ketoacyl-ACP synthase [Dongia rigui]|uniref:Beta-ketoacyl-ACP synthase n=1 Tax=Dongia rigui TaxID=940149 RepID=A0ABU5E2A9_9PROT|nr:beta-ketoacyl-ACP synthase [Dongia rigui]MDY0873335.1 beta-ketoacyl-ACP synthase [Dongia rigui]